MKLPVIPILVALALTALALGQGRGGGKPAPKPGAGGERGTQEPKRGEGDDLALDYFKTCDYDQSGWVSFDEAHASLNLDKKGFALYDTDVDGRISEDEFVARYRSIKAHGGGFMAPLAKIEKRRTPKRTPAELVEAFDADRDGKLDEHEIARALEEYGARDVDAARVLANADKDGSKLIEAGEVQAVLDVLDPSSAAKRAKVGSIEELFDRIEPRALDPDKAPQPARIVGPVSMFRRLDYDQSGGISVADLEALQRPLQFPIRIRAVLAALDTDGNGELSANELQAALR